MEDCERAGTWSRGQDEDDWEQEEFHYTVSCTRLFVRVQLMVVRPGRRVPEDLQRHVQ